MLDPRLQTALVAIEHHYGSRVIAVALFGSRVGTRGRAESEFYTEADATRAFADAHWVHERVGSVVTPAAS